MGTVADSRVTANLLLFADSRLPAGGHAHSGGVERAVAAGAVRDMPTLEGFLRGRLATAGAQSAAIAAYACRSANDDPAPAFTCWHLLDAEVSPRMSSPAQRSASRAQGRALLRVLVACWPDSVPVGLGDRPHHAVALGVGVGLAGGSPYAAALVAASASVSSPASAALRLMGFNPVEVTALIADLAEDIDRCAEAATHASDTGGPELLPSPTGLMLDVLAEDHARSEVKLFAS